MDYERIYNDLIKFRKNNVPEGYSENHHIIPSSLNGSDKEENMVRLTGREHLIAHLLLVKFNKCRETIYAAFMMSNCGDKNHIGRTKRPHSRSYERLKRLYAEEMSKRHKGKVLSEETKKKISIAQKGKAKSEKTKQRMRESANARWNNNTKDREEMSRKLTSRIVSEKTKEKLRSRAVSKETKGKIKLARVNYEHSEETKKKIGESNTGGKRSPETIERMRLAAKKRWAATKVL